MISLVVNIPYKMMLYNGKIKLDGLTKIAGFTFHSHLRQTYRLHKVSIWAQKYKLGSWACLLSSFSIDTDSVWRQVFSSLQEPNPFQQESKWTQSCDSLWQFIGSRVLFCKVSENYATAQFCIDLNISSCAFNQNGYSPLLFLMALLIPKFQKSN